MSLQIIRQDITKMRVDAIVNTTNQEMSGYSGVDLAIHTAAGKWLGEECKLLAPLGLGEAKATRGYDLPCKYIIHTSGPVWQGGLLGESIILRSCYLESLKLAVDLGCSSVALPLISSGTYGYPKDRVLKFAMQTISEFLFDHELTVYLCVFDRDSYSVSRQLIRDIHKFILEEEIAAERECLSFASYSISADSADYHSDEIIPRRSESCAPMRPMQKRVMSSAENKSLHEYMRDMDKSFSEMLFDLIDESGMTDVECYKKANVDKRVFSKIKGNKNYHPSKQTAVAFAIALHLDIDRTQKLLDSAGMTLSRSKVFDKIIRYFIHNGNYDIFEINEALFEFDQVLLGSGM